MASSIAVSKTLTCDEIRVLRAVSIGGGREHRAFSMAERIVNLAEASEDEGKISYQCKSSSDGTHRSGKSIEKVDPDGDR